MPLKTGKSTVTVKYKVGRKSYALKQKYTVAPYYKAVKSLRINGDRQVISRGERRVYCGSYDAEATKYVIRLTPASGWKIKSVRGIYTKEQREDIVVGHFTPKAAGTITVNVPLDRMAYVIYTLKNTKTGKTFDYNVGLTRFGE